MKKLLCICVALVCAHLSGQATAYSKLTAENQLSAGDTVIFVDEAAKKANGAFEQSTTTKNKYLLAVDATIGEDTVLATGALEFVLAKSGNYWTLTSTTGRKLAKKNKSDYMAAGSSDIATHTITFYDTDFKVKVMNTQQYDQDNYYIRYNSNSFRYYKANSQVGNAYLYKRIPAGKGPDIKVTGVQLSPTSTSVRVDDTTALQVTISPSDAKNKQVSWGSLDPAIATVDSLGQIVGISVGSTKIWVKTQDGNYTDTCLVTVQASLKQDSATWNIVQSIDSLKEGVRVFFGNSQKDYVLGLYNYDVANSNIRGAGAIYGERRHSVTASQSYAYTVHECGNGQWAFEDIDGRYLYMYNTNKNLSASTSLNNQAKWTVAIDDSVATIKSVYSSSFQLLFNKTAANPMFCTYSNYDSNHADIYLYSDNAPEWIEPVLYPELTLLIGTDTVDSLINIGNVAYDDSWGTEVDPYCQSKSVTVQAVDLTQKIYLSLAKGKVFSLTADSLPAKGGSFSISFSTKEAGSYSDTLTVRCGEIVRTIVVLAKTVTDEEIRPQISLSTKQVSLNINLNTDVSDIQGFTFSTKNLQKKLYIKWEKGTIPANAGEVVEIVAGKENNELHFGSATDMDTLTRTDEEVTIAVDAYTIGTYVSTLCFYTPDAKDKSKNAFEERVTITINVTDETTTGLSEIDQTTSDNLQFNLLGQPVDSSYHGLVIQSGKKRIQ